MNRDEGSLQPPWQGLQHGTTLEEASLKKDLNNSLTLKVTQQTELLLCEGEG